MNEEDKKKHIKRYEVRLNKYGYSPSALGWGRAPQSVRFDVLCVDAIRNPSCSVLDVGCGFADLYHYLSQRGWHGRYVGIDIVPGLLEVARAHHKDLELHLVDLFEFERKVKFDCVISSGAFNSKLEYQDNKEYIRGALRRMFELARFGVYADFLSTYVDYQQPIALHTDPDWAFSVAKTLSKRVALRHDYMPYEFALIIYKDDRISSRSVFEPIEHEI